MLLVDLSRNLEGQHIKVIVSTIYVMGYLVEHLSKMCRGLVKEFSNHFSQKYKRNLHVKRRIYFRHFVTLMPLQMIEMSKIDV